MGDDEWKSYVPVNAGVTPKDLGEDVIARLQSHFDFNKLGNSERCLDCCCAPTQRSTRSVVAARPSTVRPH